ncbi:DUF6796 family protein [Novosphingobium resinovorum]|uniref:DUF6796 family protein n=1 Tax=Novosphingobium resinovorum TaxID=158500 RepID=UPI002ED4596D|nr:DUF6796 family protein [Novosphingobium resinovorum]
MNLIAIRVAGIAGIVGAICWAIGDILLVGGHAEPSDYPLLLQDYADRIDFAPLGWMLPLSERRMAFGALIANFSIPLYLAGSWHLFRGARPAGRVLSWGSFGLLFCANAWSPFGHVAFYYPAMTFRTILETPVEAHAALIALGKHFDQMLIIAWLSAVVALAAGMLVLAIAIITGRSAYPRWAAAVINPVTPLAMAALGSLLPDPVGRWFYASVLNIGFFIIYTLSTALLWNCGRAPGASGTYATPNAN